jgi:hypothetical protein
VLLLIRTPLARSSTTSPRTDRATRTDGPALPGSSLRRVKSLLSSGASQETEYLSFGHSNAVWLRRINVWINNKECRYLDTSPRDFIMGHSSAVRLRRINLWINN